MRERHVAGTCVTSGLGRADGGFMALGVWAFGVRRS